MVVFGDMLADIYLDGQIARSRTRGAGICAGTGKEVMVPGGAANTVNNVAALGGNAVIAVA